MSLRFKRRFGYLIVVLLLLIFLGFFWRKTHPKKSTQNKKVHLNKFFWTISVGFLTCVTGKKAKVRANFRKSSRERGAFLVFRDFGWAFGPLFVAYGYLVWSSLLTVKIWFGLVADGGNRFGLFCLRFPPVRKLGLVFCAYGSPCSEIGFGLFCLRLPHRKQKDLNCK